MLNSTSKSIIGLKNEKPKKGEKRGSVFRCVETFPDHPSRIY